MSIPKAEEQPYMLSMEIGQADYVELKDRTVNLEVTSDNIIPEGEGHRRRPPRRDPDEGYTITVDIKSNSIEYVNVMTTYLSSHQSYAEVSILMEYVVDHLLLIQYLMTK